MKERRKGRGDGRRECAGNHWIAVLCWLSENVTYMSPVSYVQFKFLTSNWVWKPQSKSTRSVCSCSTRHSHMTHASIEPTNKTHTHTDSMYIHTYTDKHIKVL